MQKEMQNGGNHGEMKQADCKKAYLHGSNSASKQMERMYTTKSAKSSK